MNVPDITLAVSALEQKTVRLSFQNERLVRKFEIDLVRRAVDRPCRKHMQNDGTA